MTGLRLAEFADLLTDVLPRFGAAETERLTRAERQRAIGGGHPFDLTPRDQTLLTVVWLRRYPIHEVLGFLFDVSDSTVSRYIRRVLPLLEAAGRATMRLPDPGRKQRRQLADLLKETPELAVVIDSFEQRVQRPRTRSEADPYYSGKKKQHTLKSQIAVDEITGAIVDVADSVQFRPLTSRCWSSPSCWTACRKASAPWATWATSALPSATHTVKERLRARSPAASPAHRRTWPSTPPSPNAA